MKDKALHSGSSVVVSTVHRAKGSEAEHVYWIDSPLVFENQSAEEGTKADALRAAYVAVTRAKQDIRLFSMKKQYLRNVFSPLVPPNWITVTRDEI